MMFVHFKMRGLCLASGGETNPEKRIPARLSIKARQSPPEAAIEGMRRNRRRKKFWRLHDD